MPNQEFKSAYERVKSYLAKSLTADNTEEITNLGKDLDTMQQSMEKEEQDHTATKNKLVDYVKSTSFKVDDNNPTDPLDDSPKTMAEAEKIAMNKILENRKKKKEN